MRISASLAWSDGTSKASQPNTRSTARYANRSVTDTDSARARGARAARQLTQSSQETQVSGYDRILGTHTLQSPGPLPCLPLPGLGVVTIRWKTRPGGLAATECRASPARSAPAPLPPPAGVHPAMRTAIAPTARPLVVIGPGRAKPSSRPPGMAQVVSL